MNAAQARLSDSVFVPHSSEQFCGGLRTLNASERAQALAHIEDLVLQWAASVHAVHGRGAAVSNGSDGLELDAVAVRALRSLEVYAPVVLRLSSECPFEDVRQQCAALLAKLRELGSVPLPRRAVDGPSRFVPLSDIAAFDVQRTPLQDLLEDCFIQVRPLTCSSVHGVCAPHG
jgi:hypothetical protein